MKGLTVSSTLAMKDLIIIFLSHNQDFQDILVILSSNLVFKGLSFDTISCLAIKGLSKSNHPRHPQKYVFAWIRFRHRSVSIKNRFSHRNFTQYYLNDSYKLITKASIRHSTLFSARNKSAQVEKKAAQNEQTKLTDGSRFFVFMN